MDKELRILILEDIPRDAELVERELQKAGIVYTSRLVDQRDAFLKELEDFSPDIVLSDYSMPRFNGMEALQLVKERFPSIPLIIVTGAINEETAVKCMKAGAVDYVIKEHLGHIGASVRGALEKKKIREEKEEAETALRESEEKFRLLSEQNLLGIIIIQDDLVKYVNQAASEITEYSIEETLDWKPNGFRKLFHPDDVEFVMEQAQKKQEGAKDVVTHYPYRMITKSDKVKWIDQYSKTIIFEGKTADLITIIDITELRQTEEERKKLEAQLQQAQKMEAIGTLAGGIAHDFNNILGGIMGYAELAKMKLPEDSKVISDLEQVVKSSNRAADLVKQILTVSRQHKKEQRPMQVKYIVNEALKLLKATLPTTIEIREHLLKEAGIVNADPTQMHQVIMNLCINAGHAMQEDGGVLTVELANVTLDGIEGERYLDMDPGSYLRLTVSDTGHGMSPEIIERIFDPYFTTKDTGEGTGLGLSVAQGIVKVHGGTITVYSQPGKGATFHVYLPLIQEKKREEKESEGPLPTGNERILFIDDEHILVDLGHQMLERLGYEVITKKSSIEALELFRAEPDRFDLVITDVTMPHMTGDKLAQELMKIRPDIPIILCTGHSRLVSEKKAKEMGIKAFVMKPILRRTIAETVRKALGD